MLETTKRHFSILLMLTFVSGIALFGGLVQAHSARGIILDYRIVYIGARCLIRHCDLYSEADVMSVYVAEGGVRVPSAQDGRSLHYVAAQQIYPPTAELFFAPFALLPWRSAYALWASLTCGLMTLAAFLMWDAARPYACDLPFYLACIVLINSGILFSGANPAGIAVSLCVISVWCIFHERYLTIGMLCMAASLAIKPHDSGLVWLYLFLVGGAIRKRAIQSLMVVAILGIAAVAWISQVSPHWIQEMRANLVRYSTNGSTNDPAGSTAGMMVNLQAVIAVFRGDARFYNFAAYAICAPLFLVWVFVTVRNRRTQKGTWLGLAAIAALSLLPLYHRPHDAKILLLTLPACAALWAEGGSIAWMALAFTGAGILVTSDLPLALLRMHQSALPAATGIKGELLLVLTTRPAALVLLATSIFYLWAYVRYLRDKRADAAVTPGFETPDSVPQLK
ncbi:MAG: glycosyltransferase family 87 protein [Terracidiphilus sp.]